jgi:hypothetical protein
VQWDEHTVAPEVNPFVNHYDLCIHPILGFVDEAITYNASIEFIVSTGMMMKNDWRMNGMNIILDDLPEL